MASAIKKLYYKISEHSAKIVLGLTITNLLFHIISLILFLIEGEFDIELKNHSKDSSDEDHKFRVNYSLFFTMAIICFNIIAQFILCMHSVSLRY